MERLCQQSKLLFVVLEHLDQYDVMPVNNLEYRVRNAMSGAATRGADETLALLDASPWLQDLQHFKPLAGATFGGRAPLVGFLQQLGNNAKVRDEVRKVLQQRQEKQPNFGTGLVLAYLAQSDDKLGVLEYLGTQLEAVRALPDEQQLDVANLMQDLIRRDALAEKELSQSSAAARKWLLGGQADRSEALLAKIKKAKRLEELGIEYYQVREFFRKNLDNVVQTDPATAAKVVLQICDLGHEAQRRGEWHMYFGDGNSTEGYILRQAVDNIQAKDWSVYDFVVDVTRNKEGRAVETANAAPRAAAIGIMAAFNRAPKLSNGRPRPIDERIRAMYEECGPALAGRSSVLLIRGFYDQVNGQLEEKTCEKTQAWTRTEMAGGKYPDLAANLDAVVAFIASQKGAAGKRNFASGERRAMADYHEHFLAIFNNAKLPFTWRTILAELVARKEKGTLPLEVARAISKLHSDAIAADVPIVDSEQYQLALVVQSLIDDPESADLIKEWRDHWAARYLSASSRRTHRNQQYERLDRISNSGALCGALAIFYSAGDTTRAGQLLRTYDGSLGNLPRTLAVVVRADQPNQAARLIRVKWPTLNFDWPKEASSQYDAQLAALLPAVYEKLDREELRYFARLLFASMPDADSLGDVPAHDDRMRDLAGKLADVEFKDKTLYRRALVLLSRCAATRADVAPLVAEEFDVERLAAAFHSDNDQPPLEQETQLTVCHLRNRLAAGDAAALAKLLKRLNASQPRQEYQFCRRLSPFLRCARDVLREPGEAWPADDCALILAQMQAAVADRQYVYFDDSPGFNTLLTALIARTDQRAESEKWIKSLPKNSYNNLFSRGITGDVWKFGVRLLGPPSDSNYEERQRFVQNVLRFAVDRKWGAWGMKQSYYLRRKTKNRCFTSIVDANLLSKDELMEHGGELVKQVGDVRFVTAAWAAWLESVEQYKRAAAAWRQVVDAEPMPKDNSKRLKDRSVYHVLSLARCRANSGHAEEAKATLATLGASQVGPRLRKPVEKLRHDLAGGAGKKPESKTTDKPGDRPKQPAARQSARLHDLPARRLGVVLYQPAGAV